MSYVKIFSNLALLGCKLYKKGSTPKHWPLQYQLSGGGGQGSMEERGCHTEILKVATNCLKYL